MGNLIKEENFLFNNSIKNAKVDLLNKKLKEFKDKHGIRDTRDTIGSEPRLDSI